MSVRLLKPVVIEQGQNFTIRAGSKTIGTGVFTTINKNLTEIEREHLLIGKKKREKLAQKAQEVKGKK